MSFPGVTMGNDDEVASATTAITGTPKELLREVVSGELPVERFVKSADLQKRMSQPVQDLSTKLLGLAASSWQTLQERPEVAQEVAKDPFTREVKADAAIAELLILLLHACDRVASVTFSVALPVQAASVLRNSFMAGLIGLAIAAFARTTYAGEEVEEQEEIQADLLHLYNTRATQYGFFPIGSAGAQDNEALFKLAGIRLAEALECPDNAEIISHGIEVVMTSLTALREQLPLKETFGKLIAEIQ